MAKEQKKCRWTTKKGTQCKNRAVGDTALCYRHNITIRFRTQFIIGIIFLLLSAAVALIIPDIKRIIIPEKTLIEKIKIEGDKALKNKDRQQTSIFSHQLYDLGIKALQTGDYDSYNEAIWQLLRIHEFSLTSDWPNDLTTSLLLKEVSNQLISLITAKRLEFMRGVQIDLKLGEVTLVGTKRPITDYNKGKFFSDAIFTGTLELMKNIIDTLWTRKDFEFARLTSETMMEVLVAEAQRRMDAGYRICPRTEDKPQITFMGERIADVGQPAELDYFYKACYIMSRLPEPLFTAILDSKDYYKLSLGAAAVGRREKDTVSVIEVINGWRYYHPYGISGRINPEERPLLDSLLAESDQKGQEAAECVRQLLIRERYPKRWKPK